MSSKGRYAYGSKKAHTDRFSYNKKGYVKKPVTKTYKPKYVSKSQQSSGWIKYPNYQSKYLSTGLGAVGGALGGLAGQAVGIPVPVGALGGAALGKAAGDLFGKVTGVGDYHVKKNSLYMGAQIPYISNSSKSPNATVISHREYITDIVSSSSASTFKVQSFSLNPGLSQTFEWLAQIACNYTEYKIEGMLFEFRTTSVDALNSTNTALGTVIMATNYDSQQSDFESKAEMAAYEFSTICKPSENCIHPIECDPHQSVLPQMYIRVGNAPDNTDIRMYDLGKFQIATSGLQATSVNVGELWVTYQVALFKPRLYASLGRFNDYFLMTAPATALTSADPLGLVEVADSSGVVQPTNYTIVSNNFPLNYNATTGVAYTSPFVDSSTASQFFVRFPVYPQPVCYRVQVIWNWGAANDQTMNATPPSFTFNNNNVDLAYTANTSKFLPAASDASPEWVCQFYVKVNNPTPASVTVTYTSFPSATAAWISCEIEQIPQP